MKANYHTHTYLCKHASGTIEEVVEEAINNNFTVIGIGCHMPKEFYNEYSYSMHIDELNNYLEDIEAAKIKYQDKIKVLKGMECEYTKHLHSFIVDLRDKYKLDYLLLGQHITLLEEELFFFGRTDHERKFQMYRDSVLEALNTKLFDCLAHPDYFLMKYKGKWTKNIEEISREIIECAIKNDVVLELNANGFRKKKIETEEGERYVYPRQEFWQIVSQYKEAKVIIGSDNHSVKQLNDKYINQAKEFANELNIELIDYL